MSRLFILTCLHPLWSNCQRTTTQWPSWWLPHHFNTHYPPPPHKTGVQWSCSANCQVLFQAVNSLQSGNGRSLPACRTWAGRAGPNTVPASRVFNDFAVYLSFWLKQQDSATSMAPVLLTIYQQPSLLQQWLQSAAQWYWFCTSRRGRPHKSIEGIGFAVGGKRRLVVHLNLTIMWSRSVLRPCFDQLRPSATRLERWTVDRTGLLCELVKLLNLIPVNTAPRDIFSIQNIIFKWTTSNSEYRVIASIALTLDYFHNIWWVVALLWVLRHESEATSSPYYSNVAHRFTDPGPQRMEGWMNDVWCCNVVIAIARSISIMQYFGT